MAKISNHYTTVTDSDLKTQCPSCYSDNTQHVGVIKTDNGHQVPSYKCNSCNTAYVKEAEGGINFLVDGVVSDTGATGAAFIPSNITSGTDVAISDGTYLTSTDITMNSGVMVNGGSLDANLDWESKQKLDNIAQEISLLSTSLLSLMDEVKKVAKTNADLMEKLATDPLIETKKRINGFNLK